MGDNVMPEKEQLSAPKTEENKELSQDNEQSQLPMGASMNDNEFNEAFENMNLDNDEAMTQKPMDKVTKLKPMNGAMSAEDIEQQLRSQQPPPNDSNNNNTEV